MEIKKEELKGKISEILKDADLEKITSKLVRCELEKHFKQSLTSRRAEIDKMIMQSLQERQEESEESEDEVSPQGGDDDQSSSSDSASSLDMTPVPPKRSSKSKRNGKKGSSSQGKSSNKPLTDEELARQLHAEENGMRVRQRRNMCVLPWYARGGAKKRPSGENGTNDAQKPKKSKKKLCVLSEELADLVGESMMARSDVVKALWSIAKERNLFDPKDRRFIICDEQFKTIFNRQRMLMFGVMKYLTRVVKDVDDIH